MHLIIVSPQEKNKLNLPNEYENDYHSSEHHLSSSKAKPDQYSGFVAM